MKNCSYCHASYVTTDSSDDCIVQGNTDCFHGTRLENRTCDHNQVCGIKRVKLIESKENGLSVETFEISRDCYELKGKGFYSPPFQLGIPS